MAVATETGVGSARLLSQSKGAAAAIPARAERTEKEVLNFILAEK